MDRTVGTISRSRVKAPEPSPDATRTHQVLRHLSCAVTVLRSPPAQVDCDLSTTANSRRLSDTITGIQAATFSLCNYTSQAFSGVMRNDNISSCQVRAYYALVKTSLDAGLGPRLATIRPNVGLHGRRDECSLHCELVWRCDHLGLKSCTGTEEVKT
jgi:hypothetical protein